MQDETHEKKSNENTTRAIPSSLAHMRMRSKFLFLNFQEQAKLFVGKEQKQRQKKRRECNEKKENTN